MLTSEQEQAIQQQKESCPFCQIIAGKIPAEKVFEDEEIIAILDINPAKPGHLLVMPKEHYPIMPLIPEETFKHLAVTIKDITKHLRQALVVNYSTVFIANGGAAGQQASHFLIHVIPEDSIMSNFIPPKKELGDQTSSEQMLKNNLPLMMRNNNTFAIQESAPPSEPGDLAQLLTQNPELREAIINNPEAVKEEIKKNPNLQTVFSGVDIDALAQSLPKTEPSIPRAVDLNNEEVKAFIDSKETLKELLLGDHETLVKAIPEQEKLRTFFENTSPEEVKKRYEE